MQICKVYKRWFIYFTNIDISINVIKSVLQVRKHETQSNRESCVFHFSHFELYFALHSCVLSTFQQHLLQFLIIIFVLMCSCWPLCYFYCCLSQFPLSILPLLLVSKCLERRKILLGLSNLIYGIYGLYQQN